MWRSLANERDRSRRRHSAFPLRQRPGGRSLTALSVTTVLLVLVLAYAGAEAQTSPPSISGVGAREITDTTALLAGEVNPNGLHTTYRFEYGTGTSYGSTTVVDNAGSGTAGVPATKVVGGLQPNTTYHFRLVATNDAGQAQGPDQTFTTAANPPQPDGRVYEMVSPLDKNGGDIDRDFVALGVSSQSGAAASGDAAAFTSRLQFAGIESGALQPTYVAWRADTGWTTEGVTPPIANVFPDGPELPRVMGLSLDLSKAFARAGALLTPGAGDLGGSFGLYMRSSGNAERYTLLSAPWTSLGPDTLRNRRVARFEYVADTPDSRQVVFNATRQLLPEGDPPACSWCDAPGPRAVYEWVDGSLRLASVPPPGVSFDFNNPIVAGLRERGLTANLPGEHVISDDGRRLFFTATVPGKGQQLFVRQDGTTTVHVSRSQVHPDPFVPAAAPRFWAAKAGDGSVAFFTAEEPLTAGASGSDVSLYRWDATALEGQRLTELSRDPAGTPVVLGPAAVSDDATSVAFVAHGLLDPDDATGDPDDATGAVRGEPNLYLWRQGEDVQYIATLNDSDTDPTPGTAIRDAQMWTLRGDQGGRAARISANGERLLFASFAPPPDSDYDTTEETAEACGNPAAGGDTCRQIYLYDARRDELNCLTCVAGVPVTGDADLFGNSEGAQPGNLPVDAPYRQPRNLSPDGTRAFFETARPLVSGDRNTKLDVYVWEDRNLDGQGELRLISTGRSTTDSKFVDASVSGDDVFFTTREQLVGIDTDSLVDLYDARVGGGIAAQNPPPVTQCQGDECQGALFGPPFLPGVGSDGASHGNLRPRPRPSFSVRRLSPRQRAQLARGRPVAVRVRVNRGGTVRLTASAKLGRRMRPVARASKFARRAGMVRLRLRLSAGARRALARRGRLSVRMAVTFAGADEARTSTLRLQRTGSSGEGRAR